MTCTGFNVLCGGVISCTECGKRDNLRYFGVTIPRVASNSSNISFPPIQTIQRLDLVACSFSTFREV